MVLDSRPTTIRLRAYRKSLRDEGDEFETGEFIGLRDRVEGLGIIRELKEHKVECYFEKKGFYRAEFPENVNGKSPMP